jgi:hypothetical protein
MAQSTCLYGASGSFKSTQVKFFSHYIAETTGKSTLLFSADGGGWSACDPEVAAGMIIPYRADVATLPLQILRLISKGYWPEDPNETRPEKINMVPMNFTRIGGIAVEGWTSIGSVVMRYLPDNNISVGGEERDKKNMMFRLQLNVDGAIHTEQYGSNTRGDFGFVQRFIEGFVSNISSLPVRHVLHTALEAKTEEDDRSTIYGPSMPGKKATAQCGAWVGNLLHAQDYTVVRAIQVPNPQKPEEKMDSLVGENVVRVYFKKHPDPTTNIPFPAKPRVTPEKIAALEKVYPGGYFEPSVTNGLDSYLHLIDKLGTDSGNALAGWREKMDQKLGRTQAPEANTKSAASLQGVSK